MSKAERLKEEIGWLKVVFGIFVATDISMIAWLVQNVGQARFVLVQACVLAIISVTLGIVWFNHIAYRKIDELEDL